MCGLFGLIRFGNSTSHNTPEETLRREQILDVVKILGEENAYRGRDATGLLSIDEEWNSIKVLKRPVSAGILLNSELYREWINNQNLEKCKVVLGHTRQSTGGSPSNNLNNHPVIYGKAAGIHNGWVDEHQEVFKEEGLARKAEVDTEALVALFHKYSSKKDDLVKAISGKYHWSGSLIAIVSDSKNRIYIANARSRGNLYMAWLPTYRTSVISSTKPSIKRVLREVFKDNRVSVTDISSNGLSVYTITSDFVDTEYTHFEVKSPTNTALGRRTHLYPY